MPATRPTTVALEARSNPATSRTFGRVQQNSWRMGVGLDCVCCASSGLVAQARGLLREMG